MGLTYLDVAVANPKHPGKRVKGHFLVDSGALYSVVPAPRLRKLGIAPHSKRPFNLADGTVVEREIGDALFFYGGGRGAAPVVFGEPGDSMLLGAVTLEALGLCLDPLRRELRPLPMMLA
jgi:predicted aspartyl protease